MKFSTRVNSSSTAEQLFDRVTDFSRLEQMLIKNKVSVSRINPADEPGAGMAWKLAFDWRSKTHVLRLDVRRFDRPDVVFITGTSDLFDLLITITVFGLTQTRSRLIFETEVLPRNMRARVIIQTAKLAKGRLDRRYEQRINKLFGGNVSESPLSQGAFQSDGAVVFRNESAG